VVRDDWSRGGAGNQRITAPPSNGDGPPVRVVYPGNGGSDVRAGSAHVSDAPPAIGAPVRARINTSWRDTGSERAADRSPTLRDLYRKPDRTPDGDVRSRPIDAEDRSKIAPTLNHTLAGRYRERLDRDLSRSGAPRPGGDGPGGDARAAVPDARAAAPIARSGPSVANHRYPVAGREVGNANVKNVATPAPNPVLGGAVRSKAVPLEPVRTKTPTLGSGRNNVNPVPLTPTLRARSSGQWNNPHGYHYGAGHWSGHCATLGFGLGFGWNGPGSYWGCYSYPYYYSCWWPRYWWSSCGGYSSWWGYCYPNYASCYWWPAPTTCYAPIVWNSYDYGSWYEEEHSEPIVIYEVIRETVPEEEHVGAPAARGDDASPHRFAERHVGMGDYYFAEGRFQEAAESYLRALGYAPDDATIHFVLADALFATGDYHYAAFIIGKAIKLDPGLARSTADKRTFYKDAKRFDEQMGTLRGYVKDKPYDAAGWLVLGYNLKFSGDADGARKAFERVLEIDPGNETAKVFLAALTEAAPESRPASR
jgi:Tfp pilus assembly protein PilF